MDFEEITFENIEIGAQVVSKQIYESLGIKHCAFGTIKDASFNWGQNESFIEITVKWNDWKTYIYKSDSFLIVVKSTSNNPNKTFKKEV